MELGFVVLIHLPNIPDLFLEGIHFGLSWDFSLGHKSRSRFGRIFVPENDSAVSLECQIRVPVAHLFVELQIDKERLRAYVVLVELLRISRFVCLHDAHWIGLRDGVVKVHGAVSPQGLYLLFSAITREQVVNLSARLFQLPDFTVGIFCCQTRCFWFLKLYFRRQFDKSPGRWVSI